MGARPGDPVGIIYGDVHATEFTFAANDPNVKRLDYIAADHPGGIALGQIVEVNRRSELSFDDAMSLGHGGGTAGDHISCTVRVVGYRDERGLLQVPRTPFKAGTEVRMAPSALIQKVLGLTVDRREGTYIGHLRNTDSPVVLDVNHLVQKHVSILAKTGAGKSYTVGVLLEELLMRKVPIVIVDPHGEYTTLANPNIEDSELDNMRRFGVKPKGFQRHLEEYVVEERTAGRQRLRLDAEGLEARELVDVIPSKLSSAQVGILYQAVNELKKDRPYYSIDDLIGEVTKSNSNAKWNVVGALENLQATGLFSEEATPVEEMVRPGQATILNLKGAAPDIQGIAVARLARVLFDARKRGKIPPFMFVVEEAHNFCPERGTQNAVSGPELRTIASEGRKFGMGLLIVSQRPAKVDKNVLSQCNTQIIMKVTNPNDLRAIGQSVEGLTNETLEEVQRLGVGVALVAGGNLVAPVLVEIRTRMTRHGGRSVNVIVREEDAVGDAGPRPPPVAQPPEPPVDEDEVVPFALDGIDVVGAADDEDEEDAGEPEDEEEAPAPMWDLPGAFTPSSHRPEEDDEPGPWSPEAAGVEVKTPVRTILEPEPPLVDAEEAPPGPLGEEQDDVFPFENLGVREPVVDDPVDPAPEEDEPPGTLRPPSEPEDLVVHRILERVGYTQAKNPKDAVRRLKRMSHSVPTLAPDEYVRRFVRVGRTYCHSSLPDCGPCPLLDSCRLGRERLARGEVRRGRWGSRSG